jgi:hypothetical protein
MKAQNAFARSVTHLGNNGLIYLLTTLPVVSALWVYGFIGTLNRLLGDSLCSYYFAKSLGLLRSIWYWRITWSGRYSAYAFDWLTMKLFAPEEIHLFTPLFLGIWVLANIVLIHLLLYPQGRNHGDIYLPIILGPVSVLTVLLCSPDIDQSFYWIDGFRAYTLPVIVLSIYAIFFITFTKKAKSKISMVMAGLLAFFLFLLSGGFSETFAVFQFTLIGFWIFYYWATVQPGKIDDNLALFICGLIGATVAIVLVASAPGNAVRQDLVPPSPNFVKLIQISLVSHGTFLAGVFGRIENATVLAGTMFLSIWAGNILDLQITRHKIKILLLCIGAVFTSFSCFPPGVYGYSEPPPDRVTIIAVFVLASLLMASGVLVGNFLQNHKKNWLPRKLVLTSAILFISASSWMEANTLYKNRSIYIDYAEFWDQTDLLIKQAKNEGRDFVEIPGMQNWARIDQPNDNPKHWANECYSQFYDIQVFGPR